MRGNDYAKEYFLGKSLTEISTLFDTPVSTVRNRLLAEGIKLRSRGDGVRLAGPKISSALKGRKREFTSDWKQSIRDSRKAWGEKNAAGVSLKPNGYIAITRGPNKGRSIHIVKMEERLGRKLKHDEVVHHIDGNRTNNDSNNLALLTRSGHARLHRREQRIVKGVK